MLQYLSFETMEQMMVTMKTLNIARLQQEFLMLTMFHAEAFFTKLEKLPIEERMKVQMRE